MEEVKPKYLIDDKVQYIGGKPEWKAENTVFGAASGKGKTVIKRDEKIKMCGTVMNIEWTTELGFLYFVTNPYTGMVAIPERDIVTKL